MERLQKDLTAMLTHCAGLPPNPTQEQLANMTTRMAAGLESDSAALPVRIKEIISHGFSEMGWDYTRKRILPAAASKFNFIGLVSSLEIMLAEVKNWSPTVLPTDEELASLSDACNKLWDLDVNRLVPGKDYEIYLQRGKKVYDLEDTASQPLFTFVDEKALLRPTYAAFVALLDNYIAVTGQSEVVTEEEKKENIHFLNLIMDTAVMQYVHQYLLAAKKTKAVSRDQFIRELHDLWFGLYSRKARNDSSGFEHVFTGEITDKNGKAEVVGMHNWIQLYMEEKKNKLDYRGFIKPKRRALSNAVPSELEQLVTIQFLWHGELKPVSSTLVGTSPEFEMALYSLCFYHDQQAENEVVLGPYRVMITCHVWNSAGKKYIATSFPSEIPLDENEAATKIQSQMKMKTAKKEVDSRRRG